MLYLVSTPIGNLRDITLRAIDVLGSVDLIASEDTRKTGLLLKHLGIKKPQVSFYEHNEQRSADKIISLIEEGKSVALVTNAGTPGISDPGFTLVRSAVAAGVEITTIPGPTAFVSALILSGLATHSFTFRGFPPRKPGARRKFLEADLHSPYTLIYYESPHRLTAFLRDAHAVFGDRQGALVNDLTKIYEAVYRGRLSEILSGIGIRDQGSGIKGEYTVVIEGINQKSEVRNQKSDTEF